MKRGCGCCVRRARLRALRRADVSPAEIAASSAEEGEKKRRSPK
jgi:hypothetical protein